MPTNYQRSNLTKLSRMIARRSGVQPAIVERVLDALVGVVVEQVSQGNKFVFPHFFTIDSYKKKVVVPNKRRAEDDTVKVYESKDVLAIHLSRTIRQLVSAQLELWPDQPGLINALTWRDALAYLRENNKWSKDPSFVGSLKEGSSNGPENFAQKITEQRKEQGFNPMLDDDDDDDI